MESTEIEKVVSLLREEFPTLQLEHITNDLEASVRDLGIRIQFADMASIERKEDKVGGYTRVEPESGRPVIVLNGNDSSQERRFTLAHQLGHIFLHWRWMPGVALDTELKEVRCQSARIETPVRNSHAESFALELLVPMGIVEEVVQAFERLPVHMNIRRSFIGNTLSSTLKVSVSLAMTQLQEFDRRNKVVK